jgi:hypothetical protein
MRCIVNNVGMRAATNVCVIRKLPPFAEAPVTPVLKC